MDEPLSNLDAKLRVQMWTTVARLQKPARHHHRLRHPASTEAMTLGDRGRASCGPASSSRSAPRGAVQLRNLFVAGFVGSPAMNFLPGTLEDGHCGTALGDVALPPAEMAAKVRRPGGRGVDRRHPSST